MTKIQILLIAVSQVLIGYGASQTHNLLDALAVIAAFGIAMACVTEDAR